MVHLTEQRVGNTISVLTEIDEYLAEELRVVSADLVVGQILGVSLVFQNEDFRELFSFRRIQRSDERIKAAAVVEIVICRSRGTCRLSVVKL